MAHRRSSDVEKRQTLHRQAARCQDKTKQSCSLQKGQTSDKIQRKNRRLFLQSLEQLGPSLHHSLAAGSFTRHSDVITPPTSILWISAYLAHLTWQSHRRLPCSLVRPAVSFRASSESSDSAQQTTNPR